MQDRLGFLEIADAVEAALNAVPQSADTGLEAALDADRMARDIVFQGLGDFMYILIAILILAF